MCETTMQLGTHTNLNFISLFEFMLKFKVDHNKKNKSDVIFSRKISRNIPGSTRVSSMQSKWGVTMLGFDIFEYNLDMKW